MIARSVLLIVIALAVIGCASRSPAPAAVEPTAAYELRAERLSQWQTWSLRGRLGLKRDGDGGSGRLDWQQDGVDTSMRLSGALGQGGWQLAASPGWARLELRDGTVREAAGAEVLVRQATGWDVPVEALSWWVRGLVWPDGPAPERWALGEAGTLVTLEQSGWAIAWTRYRDGPGDLPMPSRMQLNRADVTIKLAVGQWIHEPSVDTADG